MLCYNPCCYSELPLIFPSACGLVDDPLLNPTVPAAGALFHQLRYGNNEVLVRQNLKRCGCWVGLSGWIEPEYPAAFLFAAHVTMHCSATQHALLQSMLLQRAASHFSICLWFGWRPTVESNCACSWCTISPHWHQLFPKLPVMRR